MSAAIGWLKQNPAALEAKDLIFEGNPQNLLINFEDDVEHHAGQTQINISGQNTFSRMPLDKDTTFGDAYYAGLMKNDSSLIDDIGAALSMTTTTKADFLTVQAAAAQSLLAPLPYQSDEMSHLNFSVANMGAKISELITDISMNEPTGTHSSAKEAALAIRRLISVVKSVASHITNRMAQQELLQITSELLEKCLNLFEIAQQFLLNPTNPELRLRMKKLAQHISANTPRILEALPGQRDITYAISTIHTALGQLVDHSEDPVKETATTQSLEVALERVNFYSSELSPIFQELGRLIHDPPGEETLDQLARIARGYQNILPSLLFAADQVTLNVVNRPRPTDLTLLIKTTGTCNVQLLQSSKEASLNPSDPALKIKVEMCARNVVEAMKQLLTACNSLMTDDGTELNSGNNLSSMGTTTTVQSPPSRSTPLFESPGKPFMSGVGTANGHAMMTATSMAPSNTGTGRRDSFDEFIRKRLDATGVPITEKRRSIVDVELTMADNDEDDEVHAELTKQLLAISAEIEESNRILLATRVQQPRPKSIVSIEGLPNSPPPNPHSTTGTVLDQALSITSAASRLVECAQARHKELLILGKGLPPAQLYKRESEWTEGLLSAAKTVAVTIAHLVKTIAAHSPELGRTVLENIVVISNEISAVGVRLLTASRVEHQVDSHTQLDLEEAAKHVTRATHRLSSTARAMIDQMDEQSEDEEEDPHSGDLVSLTEEKIKEMEHQLRVLKLQEELEKERNKLFELRKKSYPAHN